MDYVIAYSMELGLRLTHCHSHNAGASGGVFRHAGDVVLRGEFGEVVVGVQEVDDDVCGGAEALGGVDLHGQQLQGRPRREAGEVIVSKSIRLSQQEKSLQPQQLRPQEIRETFSQMEK